MTALYGSTQQQAHRPSPRTMPTRRRAQVLSPIRRNHGISVPGPHRRRRPRSLPCRHWHFNCATKERKPAPTPTVVRAAGRSRFAPSARTTFHPLRHQPAPRRSCDAALGRATRRGPGVLPLHDPGSLSLLPQRVRGGAIVPTFDRRPLLPSRRVVHEKPLRGAVTSVRTATVTRPLTLGRTREECGLNWP